MIDHVELVRVESPEGVWVMFIYEDGAADKFEFYEQDDINYVLRAAANGYAPTALMVDLRDRMKITVH